MAANIEILIYYHDVYINQLFEIFFNNFIRGEILLPWDDYPKEWRITKDNLEKINNYGTKKTFKIIIWKINTDISGFKLGKYDEMITTLFENVNVFMLSFLRDIFMDGNHNTITKEAINFHNFSNIPITKEKIALMKKEVIAIIEKNKNELLNFVNSDELEKILAQF